MDEQIKKMWYTHTHKYTHTHTHEHQGKKSTGWAVVAWIKQKSTGKIRNQKQCWPTEMPLLMVLSKYLMKECPLFIHRPGLLGKHTHTT